MTLTEAHAAKVLDYLVSDEVGLTELSEIAELDEAMVEHVEALLPPLKRKKLRPAIEKLRSGGGAATSGYGDNATLPPAPPEVRRPQSQSLPLPLSPTQVEGTLSLSLSLFLAITHPILCTSRRTSSSVEPRSNASERR